MRCIFCKQISDNSRSIEHIVPESLGNTSHILPAGVVCDKCNNYFSRKVEKVFLESPAVMNLRFHQAVPNKKGLVPPIQGILAPGIPITAYRHLDGPFAASIDVDSEAFQQIMSSSNGMIVFPGGDLPAGSVVSRFLAKAGLEVMAQRLMQHEGGIDYLVDEAQLDLIRNHARRGETPNWPYNCRQIYDQNKRWESNNGEDYQVVHEYDFLTTDQGEMYFVIAIFGVEFAINMAGPFIDGYKQWLDDHNQVSPLYFGKNSDVK